MGSIDWALVASVVITGLVVVFLALVILIVAVTIIGKIFTAIDNRKNKQKTDSKSITNVSESTKSDSTEVVLEISSEDDTDEVVAAITAAIAVVLEAEGNKNPFVIKSVKRVSGIRNVWNQAGLIENTQTL